MISRKKCLICHCGLAAGTAKGRLTAYILNVNTGEVIYALEESLICCICEVIIVYIA